MSLFGDEDLPLAAARESQLDFWNQPAFNTLQAQFRSGNMHHAVLLLGADGIGRETFADEFSRWVLCQNRQQLEHACGDCKSCHLFEAETHPDYHLLAIEEDKTQIAVDQVRQLIGALHESAHQSGWKVANVAQVAALNQNSYNALLKTLEEPQPKTLLLLQTEQLQQVPATIRSRSQLQALSIEEPKAILEWVTQRNGFITDDLTLALNLFPQAPYKAESFANDGDAFKCGEFIFDMAFLLEGQQTALTLATKWLPDIADCCLWLQLMMRDCLLLAETDNADLIALQGQKQAIETIVKSLNNQGLMQLNEKIVELRSLIMKKSPVNLSSSWQALLIFCSQLPQKYQRIA
ncbi:DNA polymerase III subunit delta' [Kangiella sp. TOML190]|uniref:DNA polymerase III subunit delta' n=1 Tax=Kangiella sp. TOML190 TaxID=2931351 RepID=UPI0020418088|nr:DNA polymerase III subunit delta' [Kangiella sp. TOML190]